MLGGVEGPRRHPLLQPSPLTDEETEVQRAGGVSAVTLQQVQRHGCTSTWGLSLPGVRVACEQEL